MISHLLSGRQEPLALADASLKGWEPLMPIRRLSRVWAAVACVLLLFSGTGDADVPEDPSVESIRAPDA